MLLNELFLTAVAPLLAHEGYWVNHPNDRGKETYRGISRLHHPSWEGWERVDRHKQFGGPDAMKEDKQLEEMVLRFYKANYWDVWLGDEIAEIDPPLAEEILEAMVNIGPRVIEWLQRCINYLNRNEKNFADIAVDGWVGSETLRALGQLELLGDMDVLYKMMNVCQGHWYMRLMGKSESQEVFARGWFSRVTMGPAR